MGEDNIKLGEGQLYFGGRPFGKVEQGEVICTLGNVEEIEPIMEEAPAACIHNNAIEEITLSLKMVGKSCERMIDAFCGISKAVKMLCYEIDPRVAHLALYGRKARIRKKNTHRAYKILEKEAKR